MPWSLLWLELSICTLYCLICSLEFSKLGQGWCPGLCSPHVGNHHCDLPLRVVLPPSYSLHERKKERDLRKHWHTPPFAVPTAPRALLPDPAALSLKLPHPLHAAQAHSSPGSQLPQGCCRVPRQASSPIPREVGKCLAPQRGSSTWGDERLCFAEELAASAMLRRWGLCSAEEMDASACWVNGHHCPWRRWVPVPAEEIVVSAR